MSAGLTARVMVLAVAALLMASPAEQAQEHVRLMPQLGTGPITSVVLSSDGRFLLTGSRDNSARLWNAETGQQIRSFTGHSGIVASVAFSPDGRSVLTGGWDNTARLWDAHTGQQICSFEGHSGPVTSVSFSPDGHTVLTGSWDKTARLWDAATGKEVRSFSVHTAKVNSAVFSPDGRYVLTGGGSMRIDTDNSARLWDATTGQQIRAFTGHTNQVNSVAFSPDGRYVLTGSGSPLSESRHDNTARLWDAATGKQIRIFAGHSSPVSSVAFSPDGRFVLTGSGSMTLGNDNTARLWDTTTGQQIRTFSGHLRGVSAVAFSPDGRSVITGSDDFSARLWDSATGQQIRIFTGHTMTVSSVAYSPDGRTLLFGSNKTARLWDVVTGQQIRVFKGHTSWVESVAYSPDGHSVLTGSQDKTARLWEAATGRQIQAFEGHTDSVDSVAFSPDGRFVLTDGASPLDKGNNRARIWDAATGRLVRAFDVPGAGASVFSPDGSNVLSGSMEFDTGGHKIGVEIKPAFVGSAHLWEAATGKQIRTFDPPNAAVGPLAFSLDGRFLLTGDMTIESKDNSARLWDAATGQQLRTFVGHTRPILTVAFSPDGQFVLTGSMDQTARLWDAGSGRQIRTFTGHTDAINSVAFSPDGRFVLTGSADTTARLWDAATGKQLALLLSFDNGGWAVTDADGRYDSDDPDGAPGLIWVTECSRIIELKQLKDNYYTPNLLASIMKGERLPEISGLDVVPAPPVVGIVSAYEPQSNHLTLSITNQGGGVGRLVVSVNDRKVAVLDHPVTDYAASKTEVTADLGAATIKPGENTIKAYAFDGGNQIRSHEAISSFIVADPAATEGSKGFASTASGTMDADYKPQFYGVVIGTANFAGNHKLDLMYPANDAESMMIGLQIGAGKLFGAENVHIRLLTTNAGEESGQPTKKNIAGAFADVKQKAKPTDVLLVYFSGHGVNLRTEKDSYYYLTTDARSLEIEDNPALRGLSTVSSTELRQWLGAKNMPLKEVLILDTCAAGAANDELLRLVEKRDVPPDQRRAVEFLKEATGTVILMGSAADKSSYEASKYGQGLLTYALLNGMRGRSIEDGSRLNVSRWFENASEDVPQLAASIGGIQKPVIAAPSGTGFPVALLDPSDQVRIPLAAVKPELIHLRCHDEDDNDPLGLEAAIREQLRELSHPSLRGQYKEPPIVYHDNMNDGPIDSLTPKIVYTISGSKVNLRLRIEQEGKTLREERLSLDSADKNALVGSVAGKLIELAAQVPLKNGSPLF